MDGRGEAGAGGHHKFRLRRRVARSLQSEVPAGVLGSVTDRQVAGAGFSGKAEGIGASAVAGRRKGPADSIVVDVLCPRAGADKSRSVHRKPYDGGAG